MLKIRLRRAGTRSKPFYRIVVSDSQRRPSGDFVETLGHYDPKTSPSIVKLDVARAEAWIRKGALASDTVRKLLERARVTQA
ncbi:MAG: 30S ribosomal protein S16 [Acidobacteria bacterium]|nr:MAG: 30S ribosomal protein S16 [Acidobacteriota bacterium]